MSSHPALLRKMTMMCDGMPQDSLLRQALYVLRKITQF